jgi:hypothetical protein
MPLAPATAKGVSHGATRYATADTCTIPGYNSEVLKPDINSLNSSSGDTNESAQIHLTKTQKKYIQNTASAQTMQAKDTASNTIATTNLIPNENDYFACVQPMYRICTAR